MLLRNALTMKSADAYREVYCWKAINCLELWGVVLATHGTSSDLQLLVYPVTQLLLGAARLVPSPRWFPVRLRLARVLVALAAATRVYVPVAPLLLEVLAWPELAKPAHGSGLCPDLLLQLKLSKNNLKLPSVQQELVEQVRAAASQISLVSRPVPSSRKCQWRCACAWLWWHAHERWQSAFMHICGCLDDVGRVCVDTLPSHV